MYVESVPGDSAKGLAILLLKDSIEKTTLVNLSIIRTPVIAELRERILSLLCIQFLQIDTFQFVIKPNTSCANATCVFKTAVDYYL